MHSKVSQLSMYVYLFSFGLFSHIGYCRLLSRVSRAADWVLVDRTVCSSMYMLTSVSSLTPHFPALVAGSLFSDLRVCVCFVVSSFALLHGFGHSHSTLPSATCGESCPGCLWSEHKWLCPSIILFTKMGTGLDTTVCLSLVKWKKDVKTGKNWMW